MTIAVGQVGTGTQGGGLTVANAGINTSVSGSSFMVYVFAANGGTAYPVTLADNMGNTGAITRIGSQILATSGANRQLDRFYVQNGVGGTGHVFTATIGTSTNASICVVEITGGATSGVLDAANTGQTANVYVGSGSQLVGPATVTPPLNGELLLSCCLTAAFNTGITFTVADSAAGGGTPTIVGSNGAGTTSPAYAVSAQVVSSNNTYNANYTGGAGPAYGTWCMTLDGFLGTSTATGASLAWMV